MFGSTTTGLSSTKRFRSAAMLVAGLLAAPVMGGVAVAGASTTINQAPASAPGQAPTPSADSVDGSESPGVVALRHNRRNRCYRDRWGNYRCHRPCRNRYRCGHDRDDHRYDRWDDDDYRGRVGGHRDRDDDDNDDNDRMYDDNDR